MIVVAITAILLAALALGMAYRVHQRALSLTIEELKHFGFSWSEEYKPATFGALQQDVNYVHCMLQRSKLSAQEIVEMRDAGYVPGEVTVESAAAALKHIRASIL
ncbi:MAG: hypothetical protein ACRCSS_05045 [Shewanella sp.]